MKISINGKRLLDAMANVGVVWVATGLLDVWFADAGLFKNDYVLVLFGLTLMAVSSVEIKK